MFSGALYVWSVIYRERLLGLGVLTRAEMQRACALGNTRSLTLCAKAQTVGTGQ